MMAGGPSGMLGGSYQAGNWSSANHVDKTEHALSVSIPSTGDGMALYRGAGNAPAPLRFSIFSGGSWSSPADVAMGVSTRAAPAIVAAGATAAAVFHGDDYKHYFASYQASWMPTAEAVALPNNPASQSYGPNAAAIAQLVAETVVVFPGNDSVLYAQTRIAGQWQQAKAVPSSSVTLSPAIVALSSGDLLVAFVNKGDSKLMYTTRSAGTWAAPKAIDANSYSGEPPRLAALSSGEALVSFRGLDGKAYAARYVPANMPAWAMPAPIANPNPAVSSAPAVTVGIDGLDAELLFIKDVDGSAHHTRLSGNSWSVAVKVGGSNLSHVAAASAP